MGGGRASPPRPSVRSVPGMRAVQITEFGSPEVLTVVDVPEPQAGPGRTPHDGPAAGINYADTHHRLSRD